MPRGVESVRIATCQLQARAVKDFDEFIGQIEYFVDVAADYEADFIVFPEMFTLMLLSAEEKELNPIEAIEALSRYTPRIRKALSEMALRYNINIIGGSHPTRMDDGDIHNVAYVCLRDGSVHEQEKIHPTPNEAYWWNIRGGDSIDVIQTDCGPIGVLICYDIEFPELARRLVDEGARIMFVPFCTDSRQGYMRVRYCCAGAGDREPVLRGDERQCRQPAQRRQHGHPVRPELHPDPVRLPLRARRDCRRGERECRDADDQRRQPGRPVAGRAPKAPCATSPTGASTSTASNGTKAAVAARYRTARPRCTRAAPAGASLPCPRWRGSPRKS